MSKPKKTWWVVEDEKDGFFMTETPVKDDRIIDKEDGPMTKDEAERRLCLEIQRGD